MRELTSTLLTALLVCGWADIDPLRNCPASRLIDPPTNGTYPYPEFYFNKIYNLTEPTNFPPEASQYNCNTKELLTNFEQKFRDTDSEAWISQLYERHKSRKSFGENIGIRTKCATNICPIEDANMKAAWAIQTWDFRADALCLLKEGMTSQNGIDSTKTRLIAFGGSMTRGHGALGYCCVSRTEAKEAELAQHEGKVPEASIIRNDTCMTDMHSPNRFDTSKWYCCWFGYLMQWFLNRFPKTDFEFFNFAMGGTKSMAMAHEVGFFFESYNISLTHRDIIILDHSCNDLGGQFSDGIELLIRAILHQCKSEQNQPTIVVMEQHGESNEGYREAARYYDLPVFSFSEIILHPTEAQKPMFDWKRVMPLHVPWHSHLLIADAFSRWMSDVIADHCPPPLASTGRSWNLRNYNSTILPLRSSSTEKADTIVYKLKGPIHPLQHARSWECDKSIPPLLHATPATSSPHPKDLMTFEKHLSGWTEYIDIHPPAAWMINKYAPNSSYNLVFPLPNITNTILDVGFRLKYLRTYLNAGVVRLSVCGCKEDGFRDLDALAFAGDLEDEMRNVSIPQHFSVVLSPAVVTLCQSLPNSLRNITVRYLGVYMAGIRDSVRHDYKFKVFSATMCYIDTND